MFPSKKTKVFFPTDNVNVDGNSGTTAKPPCWFVFWKQGGAVANMSDVEYKPTIQYGQWDGSQLWLGPLACGTNSGPETLYDMNNNSFTMTGQGKHIQCVAESIAHERYHKYCTDNYSGGTHSDVDGLPDGEENTPSQSYFKQSDPANYNTFSYSYSGTYQDQEVRCRLVEIYDCGSYDPSKDWSADTENSQWQERASHSLQYLPLS